MTTLVRKGPDTLRKSHLAYVAESAADGVLHCFLLDGSASMLGSLADAKGWLLAAFERFARERSPVALIRFGGEHAQALFGPAVPRWWNERWIAPIGGGGATPLVAGIACAEGLLARARTRQPAQERVLWVLTDGRTTDCPVRPLAADRVVVVDCERGRVAWGGIDRLVRAWDAEYLRLDDIATGGGERDPKVPAGRA